jgi:Crp-like helix-turn-helix protein
VLGLADERSYHMPLTQELIGDALGQSVPHVSRTLRQLRKEDLVAIKGQRVVIKDLEAPGRLADSSELCRPVSTERLAGRDLNGSSAGPDLPLDRCRNRNSS